MNYPDAVTEIGQEIIDIRRDIHRHPELGFEVHRTAGLVADYLKKLGLPVKTGVGKTGVVADLAGGHPGPTIALRADMDALPIQETGDVSYRSTVDGVMHACGHDGHTAMLLGAAKVLTGKKENIHGDVRFIFQPAEEGDGGARYMIGDGCLDGVDEIYGLHLWNYQPAGEIGLTSGPVLSCADIFEITIEGSGGHGAAPQGTRDAIVTASSLVSAFQTIISRNVNPLDSGVVTVGTIHGGDSFNIIAEKVTMTGTVRAYREEVRQLIKTRMNEIIHGAELAYGVTIDFNYIDGYPPTVNTDKCVDRMNLSAEKITPGRVVEPYLTMGGEDFSYYLQKIPGCFAFIGSRPSGREPMSVPHHCSHFDIEEASLLTGTSLLVQLIMDLKQGEKT